MRELSIEEKARRYDESIERAKVFKEHLLEINDKGYADEMDYIFPALKESEDEGIRKGIIKCVKFNMPDSDLRKNYIAWLERQCEQYNNEDIDILQRFSFYSYKDEPNVLYLSNVFVNEEFRNKGIGTKILEVSDKVAKSLNCHTIRLKTKKNSNAERLYRTYGYNSLAVEESDEIWLEKQDKKKFTDKVEPKFKVGDIVKRKDNPHLTYILKRFTDDGDYEFHAIGKEGNEGCTYFSVVKYQDEWELVEHKPINEVEPFDKYEGLTDFERTLADICIGWIGEELGWKQYIKDNADVLLKIAIKKFNSVQDISFEQNPAWSEEDEKYLKLAIDNFQTLGNSFLTNWIKSIKYRILHQNTWKLNDEHIKTLEFVIKSIDNMLLAIGHIDNVTKPRLKEILVAIKKLREVWKL